MSEIDSNTDKKQRIILKNPDGTFTYCYKSGERDSACEEKGKSGENLAEDIGNNINNTISIHILSPNIIVNSSNNTNNFLYLSDDELRNLVDSTNIEDYPLLVEQLLDIFRRYRFAFTLITLFEMFLTFILTLLTWEKRETAITILEEIYKDINSKEAAASFYTLFVLTLSINIVYYPFSFYALAKKSVRLMRIYSFFIIFNAMFILLSIYINMYRYKINLLNSFRLFVFVFVFRLLLYAFSRFLCNLLIALLLIPVPRNFTNYNSIV